MDAAAHGGGSSTATTTDTTTTDTTTTDTAATPDRVRSGSVLARLAVFNHDAAAAGATSPPSHAAPNSSASAASPTSANTSANTGIVNARRASSQFYLRPEDLPSPASPTVDAPVVGPAARLLQSLPPPPPPPQPAAAATTRPAVSAVQPKTSVPVQTPVITSSTASLKHLANKIQPMLSRAQTLVRSASTSGQGGVPTSLVGVFTTGSTTPVISAAASSPPTNSAPKPVREMPASTAKFFEKAIKRENSLPTELSSSALSLPPLDEGPMFSLRSVQLDGVALPDRVFDVAGLRTLNLSDCGLTTIPANLLSLKGLKKLVLSDNKLASLPPGLGGELAQLQELILSRNELTSNGVDMGHLGALAELTILMLNDNMLDHLPTSLLTLKKLQRLSLANNHIESLPNNLTTWSSLSFLSLNNNYLTDLPASLVDVASLRGLSFEHNNIKKEPLVLATLRARVFVIQMQGNPFFTVHKSSDLAVKRISRITRVNAQLAELFPLSSSAGDAVVSPVTNLGTTHRSVGHQFDSNHSLPPVPPSRNPSVPTASASHADQTTTTAATAPAGTKEPVVRQRSNEEEAPAMPTMPMVKIQKRTTLIFPTCNNCGRPIEHTTDLVQDSGYTWHESCFRESEELAPACEICGKPIVNATSLEERWHADCYADAPLGILDEYASSKDDAQSCIDETLAAAARQGLDLLKGNTALGQELRQATQALNVGHQLPTTNVQPSTSPFQPQAVSAPLPQLPSLVQPSTSATSPDAAPAPVDRGVWLEMKSKHMVLKTKLEERLERMKEQIKVAHQNGVDTEELRRMVERMKAENETAWKKYHALGHQLDTMQKRIHQEEGLQEEPLADSNPGDSLGTINEIWNFSNHTQESEYKALPKDDTDNPPEEQPKPKPVALPLPAIPEALAAPELSKMFCRYCVQKFEPGIKFVQVLNSSWHTDCLRCMICRESLAANVFEIDGAPYCENHFCEINDLICKRCQKNITTGAFISTGDLKYHEACFYCDACGCPLNSSAQVQDKLMCLTCMRSR